MGKKRKERHSSSTCSDDRDAPSKDRHEDDAQTRESLNGTEAASVASAASATAAAVTAAAAAAASAAGETRPEASNGSRKKRRKDKKKKRRKGDGRLLLLPAASGNTPSSSDAPGVDPADEGDEPEQSDPASRAAASGTFSMIAQVLLYWVVDIGDSYWLGLWEEQEKQVVSKPIQSHTLDGLHLVVLVKEPCKNISTCGRRVQYVRCGISAGLRGTVEQSVAGCRKPKIGGRDGSGAPPLP